MLDALKPAPELTGANLSVHYDNTSIALHWATALLVLLNFALAETWDFFPRPEHHLMIIGHISFGILLTAVIAARIIWRWKFGRALPAAGHGALDLVAKALHHILYVLVVAEVLLGYATRWTDNQPLNFFGLIIPSPFGHFSKATGRLVDNIHDYNAWIIMGLVGIHAVAAIGHHFLLKDKVLRRMLPSA